MLEQGEAVGLQIQVYRCGTLSIVKWTALLSLEEPAGVQV